MNDTARSLPDVVVVDPDAPSPLGSYGQQVHPDDIDSLVALIEVADVVGAHAIVRVRDAEGAWTLVEHRPTVAGRGVVLSRLDVAVREKARERAGRTEAYWRTILRNGHESIAVLDPLTLRIRHASDQLAELLGLEVTQLVGRRGEWFVDRRDLGQFRNLIAELRTSSGGRIEMEIRLRRREGPALWMQAVFSDARNDPDVSAIVVNLRDIGDRKRAEERLRASEQLFRVLLLHLADGAIVIDTQGLITFVSERAAEVIGRPAAELVGRPVPLTASADGLELGPPSPEGLAPPLHLLPDEVRGPGGRWLEIVHHDLTADPVVDGVVLIIRDVTDRRSRDERLRREVELDPLTGLLNRRGFDTRIEDQLRVGAAVSIAFLDLDGFKAVNDAYGHATGDALLAQVARRLRRCVRPDDLVARLGGDEFVVAFVDATGVVDVDELTSRVVAAVHGDYSVEGHSVAIGVSAGWSEVDSARGLAEALREADQRMYRNKRSQR